jgi:hypothetical protein
MGLEGLVSKRGDRLYRGGRSPYWIKVKNRRHQSSPKGEPDFGPRSYCSLAAGRRLCRSN